jgi:hypothetical protein
MNLLRLDNKMNKKTLFNSIILSAVIFSGVFLFYQSARAEEVQFGDKDIFVDFDGLPFNLSNWAPGNSAQKTIVINNNENFDIDVYLKASSTSTDKSLANVLTITTNNQSKHLSDLFDNNITLGSVNSGGSQDYDVAIKFDEDAGNEYQGKTINFDFIITAEQTEEDNGEIPPVIIPGGGGGGVFIAGLEIYDEAASGIGENSVTITWRTNLEATSQVIYSAEEEGHELNEDNPPLYGYAHAYPVPEDSALKTGHEIELLDLEPCTTYYYRIVAKESPSSKPTISKEFSFTTACVKGETTTTDEGGKTGEIVISPGPSSSGPSGEVAGEWDEEEEEPEGQSEEKTEEPLMVAGISDVFEDVGIVCHLCFPWWALLIIAAIPLLLALLNKKRTRDLLIKHWAPWSSILVIIALIFYFMEWYCVPVIVFLLVFLFTVLYNFFFIPNEKTSRWEGSIERRVEVGSERKKYVLILGLLTFLLLLIIWFFLKCFYLWVLAIIAVIYLLINETIRSRVRK